MRPPLKDKTMRRRVSQRPPTALYARFDTIALHKAMYVERRKRKLTWTQVADELGITTGVIDRFTLGGRTHADLMIAAAWWAGKPVEALTQPSTPVLSFARMDAKARKPQARTAP